MKDKKKMIVFSLLLITMIVGIFIWKYEFNDVTANQDKNIIYSDEEEIVDIEKEILKELEDLSIKAAKVANSIDESKRFNIDEVTDLDKERAVESVEEKISDVYSENSEYAELQKQNSLGFIEDLSVEDDYYIDEGIKNVDFRIVSFDNSKAKAKMDIINFGTVKDTSDTDDTAGGKDEYFEQKISYIIEFVFENEEWKIDVFKIDKLEA